MKRPWPEEDDFFMICVGIVAFMTVCITMLICMD